MPHRGTARPSIYPCPLIGQIIHPCHPITHRHSFPKPSRSASFPTNNQRTMAATEDLDDILNNALDELDDEEDEQGGAGSRQQALPPPTKAAAATEATGAGAGTSTPASSSSSTTSPAATAGEDEEKELRDTIAKTIDMLGKMGEGGGGDASGLGGEGEGNNIFDEAFLNKLMDEFDRLGAGFDGEGGAGVGGGGGGGAGGGGGEAGTDSMVDAMVRQLLAKDLMYPPLKEVTKQFPAWLKTNKGKVEEGLYAKYESQSALFESIVGVYEAEEEDMPRLLDLMTKAQEYGQPPPEIVQALGGPGMEGVEGVLPPGMLGALGGDGTDPEACCVM